MKYVKTLLGFLISAFLLSLLLIVCLLLQSGNEVDGDADGDDEVEYDSDERERMRELISKKLQRDKGTEKVAELDDEERGKKPSRRCDAASFISYFFCFLFLFLFFLTWVWNEHFSQFVICHNDLLGELLTFLML